jgi:hypothetical protein
MQVLDTDDIDVPRAKRPSHCGISEHARAFQTRLQYNRTIRAETAHPQACGNRRKYGRNRQNIRIKSRRIWQTRRLESPRRPKLQWLMQ